MASMRGLVLTAEWDPKPDYRVTEWERTTRKAITGSSVYRRPRVSVETVPDPKPGPNDVLLRPRACGICGSDVTARRGIPATGTSPMSYS